MSPLWSQEPTPPAMASCDGAWGAGGRLRFRSPAGTIEVIKSGRTAISERPGLPLGPGLLPPWTCSPAQRDRGDFFGPRSQTGCASGATNGRGWFAQCAARPEERAMAPHSSEGNPKNERVTTSMLMVAMLWGVIIFYFALHSALN